MFVAVGKHNVLVMLLPGALIPTVTGQVAIEVTVLAITKGLPTLPQRQRALKAQEDGAPSNIVTNTLPQLV